MCTYTSARIDGNKNLIGKYLQLITPCSISGIKKDAIVKCIYIDSDEYMHVSTHKTKEDSLLYVYDEEIWILTNDKERYNDPNYAPDLQHTCETIH